MCPGRWQATPGDVGVTLHATSNTLSTKVAPDSDAAAELAELVRCSRRRRRYELHHWRAGKADRLAGGKSAATCMRAHEDVTVSVTAGGQAHLTGVKRCGSIWSCPVCAPTIREQRAGDIDAACSAWTASGGQVWFVSATIPHQRGDDLGELMSRLQSVWSWAWGGDAGRELREVCGIDHTIRAWDHTYGSNGWHPHFHALLFVRESELSLPAGKFLPTLVAQRLRESWAMHGLEGKWVPGVSVDIRPVVTADAIGTYCAKVEGRWGAGLELARADLKRGHGVNPWQVMELASTGEARWVKAWASWEKATKGRNAIVWSRGLRDVVGLGEELTDEELAAADEPADRIRYQYRIPADIWNRTVSNGRVPELLEQCEQGVLAFRTHDHGPGDDPPPP